jgi:hypothetical protein
MDSRLLSSDASPEDRANHRTGVEITTKFLYWKLRTGDEKAWSKFVRSPGTGVVVERLSASQSRIPKCRLVAVDPLTGSNPAIQDEDLVPSERRFRGTTIGT